MEMLAIPDVAKPYVCAAVLAAAFFAGWSVNGWRLNAEILDIRREHAEQLATALSESAQKHDTALAQAAEIDLKRTKELTNAQKEIERLRASVGSGRGLLRLAATCPPGMPQAAPGPRVDPATGPRLTDAAQRDYFVLRQGIATITEQLGACQEILAAERMQY